MNVDNWLRMIDDFSLLGLVKIMVIVGISLYVFFAYLMVKQISLLSKAIKMRDDYVLKILGMAHFVYAILVLFLAFVIL